MHLLETIQEVRTWRAGISGSLGLVPTMGALHEGHLALIRRARQENDHVAVSIFVNPLQFSAQEDLADYPRPLKRDLELLCQESVDVVFVPDAGEMYLPGTSTEISIPGLTDRLEGASRPGHFAGVAVVVCKLLNIFQPDRACFGQKDAQQVVVVRKMVEDLNIPVEIVPVETIRDADGVAVSSRNVRLSADERQAARCISRSLFAARGRFQEGERSAEQLRELVAGMIAREPLLKLDYVSLADATNLDEMEIVDRPAVLSVAVECGTIRLIDNVLIENEP